MAIQEAITSISQTVSSVIMNDLKNVIIDMNVSETMSKFTELKLAFELVKGKCPLTTSEQNDSSKVPPSKQGLLKLQNLINFSSSSPWSKAQYIY